MRRMVLGVLLALALTPLQAMADDDPSNATLHRMTVRLTDHRFDPERVELKRGAETELTVVNTGTVMHEFITSALTETAVDLDVNGVVTEALGIAELEVPPQAKVVLRFVPAKAGEFALSCEARRPQDHLKAGMKGVIVVH